MTAAVAAIGDVFGDVPEALVPRTTTPWAAFWYISAAGLTDAPFRPTFVAV